MEAHKTLVTFDSKESMDEALSTRRELLLTNHFKDVRQWSENEWCQMRRTWIECYGIPAHAWNKESIQKIGEVWGKVVCLNKNTEDGRSISVTRTLIDTCVSQFIHEWIYLSSGGKGYDIYVKEIRKEVYNVKCFNDRVTMKN